MKQELDLGYLNEAQIKGFDYELCLKPNPIIMNGKPIETIVVTDDEGGLISSITSTEIISEEGTKVIVVPVE